MPRSLSTFQRYLVVVLCAIVHGLNHSFAASLVPLYEQMRADFGLLNVAPVTLLFTISAVVYCITSLPYGYLADRMSRKWLVAGGMFAYSLAFLALAFSESYGAAMLWLIVGGVAGGSFHPPANALVAGMLPERVGLAMGISGMGSALGFFLGPQVGGWLGEMHGWRYSCLMFSLAGFFMSAVFAVFGRDAPGDDVQRSGQNVFRFHRMLVVLLVVLGVVFSMRDFSGWGSNTLTSLYMLRALDFSESRTGLYLGLINLAGLAAMPLLGRLSDLGKRGYWVTGTLLMCGVFVSLIPRWPAQLLPLGLMIFGFWLSGSICVVDAAIAETVPPYARGRMFGLVMTFGGVVVGNAPFVMGLLVDHMGEGAELAQTYFPVYAVLGLIFCAPAFGIPLVLRLVRRLSAEQ